MNRLRLPARCALPGLFLLLVGPPALAAPGMEEYAALPAVHMMSVSPDGKLVAFRTRQAERDMVLVWSLEEKKVVTGIDAAGIRPAQLYFLDRERVILVAEDEDFVPGFRGYHRMSTAFSLDVASGAFHQLLTPGVGIIGGQVGLGRIVGASADGNRVFMPALTGKRGVGVPDFSLMEVDLSAGKTPRMVERGSYDTVDYFVDADGKALVEEIFDDDSDLHTILAYHDGKPVRIYRERTEFPDIGAVALTADRKSLIFEDESADTDRSRYFSMSLADGAISGPIFKRADADVHSIVSDINRVAYGVIYSGLMPGYEFFDDRITARMEAIQAKFAGNSVWLTDASPDLRHLVVRVEGPGSSGDYFLSSDDGSLRFLSRSRPGIAPESVNPVTAFDYEARDGAVIPALLTVPRGSREDAHPLPAVVVPHGGPEAHDWLGFDWLAQALASQGYAVIQPQFRGSSGFGVEHLLAGRGEWGKRSQDDITDALRHLVAEGVVDPKRVCIAGASYGGYAALAGGAFTPELYRCVVSVAGVSDVRKMLSREKADFGRDHSVVAYWNEVIARGNSSKETMDTISPANFAPRFAAPVLLLHGDRDNVVDFDQSLHMERQLKRAGKRVELVTLKGEDHDLSNAATRRQCLDAMLAFIERNIGRTPAGTRSAADST